MNNVLITGGAGFIGSEIVCQLNKAGVKSITVLDSLTEQIHGKDLQNSYLYKKIVGKCKFVKGSVTDIDTVLPLVKEADYIITSQQKLERDNQCTRLISITRRMLWVRLISYRQFLH